MHFLLNFIVFRRQKLFLGKNVHGEVLPSNICFGTYYVEETQIWINPLGRGTRMAPYDFDKFLKR